MLNATYIYVAMYTYTYIFTVATSLDALKSYSKLQL